MTGRRIYASSNGDVWDLVRDTETGRVHVTHTPNLASGGTTSHIAIDVFLARGGHSAECVALIELIGTLADRPNETSKVTVTDSIRSNPTLVEHDIAHAATQGESVISQVRADKYIEAAQRDRVSPPDMLPGDVEAPSE